MSDPLPKLLEEAVAAFEKMVAPLSIKSTQVSLNFSFDGKILSVDVKSNSHWQRPLTMRPKEEGNVF